MKTCFKCGEAKELSEFYRHSGMVDGHLNKCKDCTRVEVRANRAERLDYYREYDRVRNQDPVRRQETFKSHKSRMQDPVRRERHAEAVRRNNAEHPEKRKANDAVGRAIRDGRLKPEPCWCGAQAQAHHEDYAKPLEVIWLCAHHHGLLHARLHEKPLWPNEWHPTQCRNCVMKVFHSSPHPIGWQLRPWGDPFVRTIIRERVNALRYQPYSS